MMFWQLRRKVRPNDLSSVGLGNVDLPSHSGAGHAYAPSLGEARLDKWMDLYASRSCGRKLTPAGWRLSCIARCVSHYFTNYASCTVVNVGLSCFTIQSYRLILGITLIMYSGGMPIALKRAITKSTSMNLA